MKTNTYPRVIMDYEGAEAGPLLVVIGALHGNETAGLKALSFVHKMLDVEPITNPAFFFKGKILGLTGNLAATNKKMRYIDEDLNRMWSASNIERIKDKNKNERNTEDIELLCLLSIIETAVYDYRPPSLYILDLHTTSSSGGIFTIPNKESQSIELAKSLHAPVILDMLSGINGTTLHYFNSNLSTTIPITSVTFEAGQHEDPLSVNRCIAAIITMLRAIGSVKQEDVENIHDDILSEYAKDLPGISRFLYKHDIQENEKFVMNPGYKNFQKIKKNDILAYDIHGAIKAECDGLILMPLYQKQGKEGFYVIKPL